MAAVKTCSKCGESKPDEMFAKHPHRQCRACVNAYWTARRAKLKADGRRDKYVKTPEQISNVNSRWKFGISRVEVLNRLKSQGGGCGVCGATEPGGRGWHLDHDHAYAPKDARGHRGVLCMRCNTALGLLKDDPALLRRAAEYLDAHARRRLAIVPGGNP